MTWNHQTIKKQQQHHNNSTPLQTTGSHLVYRALACTLSTELIHLILGFCKSHLSSGWSNLVVPTRALADDLHFRLWIHFLEWDNRRSDQSISLHVCTTNENPVWWVAGSARRLCDKDLLLMCNSSLVISAKKVSDVEYGYIQSVHSDRVLQAPITDLWCKVASHLVCM